MENDRSIELIIKSPRKFEDYPSKNKFFCKGYLLTSKERKYYFLSSFLINAIGIADFAILGAFIWNEISLILIVVKIWLFLIVNASLLLTAYQDPGIIPRAKKDGKKKKKLPFFIQQKKNL